jgi:hypothetical protein
MGMVVRRYSLLIYWLVFAMLTLHQAQVPGFMSQPDEWRYWN